MPCYNPRQEEWFKQKDDERKAQVVKRKEFEAVLCGVFRALGEHTVLSSLDWTEIGVSKMKIKKWLDKHQAEDEAR